MAAHNRAVERQRERGEFTSFYSAPAPPVGSDILGEVPVVGAFQHSTARGIDTDFPTAAAAAATPSPS
eukprot:1348490-Prorocentrum_lima.AAC.1